MACFREIRRKIEYVKINFQFAWLERKKRQEISTLRKISFYPSCFYYFNPNNRLYAPYIIN